MKIRLGSPRFQAFLVAQFLGAANDNAFKVTLILLILATVPDETSQVLYASLASAFFPIPFLLFSPTAGWLADRYPKHRVLFATKLPEVAAMGLATAGFGLASLPLLLAALFVMATQSAFFSPAKYGLFPEVFANEDLSMANGFLELTTNLAILTGSIVGVLVYGAFRDSLAVAGLVYLGVALVGTAFIAFAPRAPDGRADARFEWNVLSSATADWREARKSTVLFYTLLGIAWFSFLGSFFLTLIPVYGKNVLGLSEEGSGVLLAILSIGIGVGSVAAGKLSRGHVEIGLVPLGAVGISLVAFHLALGDGGGTRFFGVPLRTTADLLALGLFSGLFIVPLNALLQQRAPEGMKGRLVAFSNVLSFSAVLLSAGVPSLLASAFGLGTGGLIFFVACLTVVGTVIVLRIVPDFFVRLVFWLATNTIYRIRTIGAEKIPRGGVLFVANHVSWVDWLLISGACDRMIRFLMYRAYYEWPVLNGFFRRMGVIPVAAGDPPAKTEESLSIARAELEAGHAVCIFAEGAITRTGNLLKFKRGFEKIAAGTGAPIVPVYLGGVWGSLFSFERGRFFLKRPKRFRARITVAFGEPLPPTAKGHDVRREVQRLAAVAMAERKPRQRTLAASFLATVRRHPRRRFLVDEREAVTFADAFTRALRLRGRLFPEGGLGVGETVGIAIPPGVGAALVNLAVVLAGRVPVNLDPSEGGRFARIAARRIRLRRVITAAALTPAFEGYDATLAEPLLEDARRASKLPAIAAPLLPRRLAERLFLAGDARDVGALATVLFWWPPDAPELPLGACLTHHALISNLESLRQVFDVDLDDAILGCVPLSNPIGFLATLWVPAVSGAAVIFADAEDGAAIGRRIREEKVTIVPVTPPILERIRVAAAADDLRSVRFVATGGGDLPDESRLAFRERFGVEPLEGYGRPEAGGIVSLNVPELDGIAHQIRARPGSTGQPLPGVAVRIVDPATGAVLGPGEPGILQVHGPNLMTGYLGDDAATRRALADGWLVTGDRAELDDDGFLHVH